VYDKVVAHGSGEPGSAEISAAAWIRVHQVQDELAVRVLQESLGAGESEAIVLAQELHDSYVLIDDALARRRAHWASPDRYTGSSLDGEGERPNSCDQADLDELRSTDFRMSERVCQDVLSKAGES
jgi:predicted nucleic acid-binding protein